MIEEKVNKIALKFNLNTSNKYLKEALCVSHYKDTLQKGTENNWQIKEAERPNQALAIVGDRYLKLVLSIKEFNKKSNPKKMNDFTIDNENNGYLAKLGIIEQNDAYALEDGKFIENKKRSDDISIATLVEAIIGALYLDEYERVGTSKVAFDFIDKYIINKLNN